MKQNIKIGLAQINPVLGDLPGNAKKITNFIKEADQQGIDLLIFPELAITGYLPQDLLLNRSFIDCNLQCLNKITAACRSSMVVILGYVARENGKLYNAATVIKSGQLIATRYKTLLPNYDVFDERRYFTPANENLPVPIEIGGHSVRLGVEICEDLWDSNSAIKVTDQLVAQGAELLVNLSASPFEYDKRDRRRQLADRPIRLRKQNCAGWEISIPPVAPPPRAPQNDAPPPAPDPPHPAGRKVSCFPAGLTAVRLCE